MLAYIRGILTDTGGDAVIVENQGIGYRIYTSALDLAAMPPLGETVTFYLHMAISERDGSISLYGFRTEAALESFQLLLGVTKIGPRAALAILSALSPDELYMAIISGDVKALTKANGIAAKGAQRIIMELKDKLDVSRLPGGLPVTDSGGQAAEAPAAAAGMALVSLGYSQTEAMQAIRRVEGAEDMDEETLLKAALKKLV